MVTVFVLVAEYQNGRNLETLRADMRGIAAIITASGANLAVGNH